MKLACIADLHISTRWIGDLSIIDQSIYLADKLIEYCKVNDIHHLAILGDIVDKSIDRSEVTHAAFKIFKKFSDYFTEVYYILGQHDVDTNPIGEVRETDTLITLTDFHNIHYMNGKIIQLGSTKIGFSNFSRKSEYRLPEYVDLFLTHFTISERFGQKIDQSNFGVMIAGDIHHKVQIGNKYSVGSFQQQSVSKDSEWNNVTIWDTETKSLVRDNFGGGRILRNSEIHSGLVDGIFYEYKPKPQLRDSETKPLVDKFMDDNYLKIVERVREFMIDKGLESMNEEVIHQVTDSHNFSTNFTIEYLKVHNFRKIRDVEIEFNKGDKVLLTGSNGSGKSTFLISLFAALTGNFTWSHVQGEFDNEVYTEVRLTYGGVTYTLRRGSGYQYLKCGDQEIPYKNRNDFGGMVSGKLPFIQDLSILFQRPEVGTLFEGIGSDAKLGLVSKVYHLEYLDQLYESGEKIKKVYVNKLNEVGYEIKNKSQIRDKLMSDISDLGPIPEHNLGILKSELDGLIKLQSDSDKYKNLLSEKNRLDALIEANLKLVSDNTQVLNSIDFNEVRLLTEKYNNILKAKVRFDEVSKSIQGKKSDINRLKVEINSLESNRCPRCNQIWIDDASIKDRESTKSKISSLEVEINSLEAELSGLQTIKPEFDMISEYKSQLDSKSLTINSCNSTIDRCNKEIDAIRSKLDSLELPDKVEFTQDDLNRLLEIKSEIEVISKYMNLNNNLVEINKTLGRLDTERMDYQAKVDELGLYNWYVCRSGPIYRDILDSLCESWSNDKVRFSIYEGVYRGNNYLDIKISYLKGTKWQDYSQSSSGEKSYMDILFIKSVTANAGFLILDEFLRHMDPDLTERSIDEIKSMNTNLFILSSFYPNLYFANRNIRARYIPENDECEITVD